MKRIWILLMVLILSLSMVACTGDSQEEPQTEVTDSEEIVEETPEETTEESPAIFEGEGWSSAHYNPETMKGLELNMYAVTDSVEPILREFEEDTDIKISHLTMGNAEMLQRIESEAEAGINIADLWFTGGADTFIT